MTNFSTSTALQGQTALLRRSRLRRERWLDLAALLTLTVLATLVFWWLP
jgi:hypothetical protein